ncbi:MAG: diaminopimelate decarboxylase [Proteobacteria bacterium]|nr:diaminopimelate decarboxylase [Pseudomonadota bacterium]
MDHFAYKGGVLHAEDVPLARIADAVGTPFYCYSTATLVRHYRVFAEGFDGLDSLICYSVKANSNLAVIGTLAALGAGADVVSEGEIRRALAGGVPAHKIVFSGVGKSRDEMAAALDAGIMQFNIESEPELAALSAVASARNATAQIAVRINPDIDAATHDKIATGRKDNKFGIPWPQAREVYRSAAASPGIEVVGLAMHIGSQLIDLAPFEAAFTLAARAVAELRADGHDIRRLDLGGGLGVPYGEDTPPLPADYAVMVRRCVGDLGCQLIFEPGRLLAANAGILVCRIIYVKETGHKTFLVVDAAMNDLLRPALYEAGHEIVPLKEPAAEALRVPVDIVGPICESGDILALARPMPPVIADDLLAVRTAGAYGSVMASTYNSRLLVPEVLVKEAEFSVVRERQTFEELLGGERLPAWLVGESAA